MARRRKGPTQTVVNLGPWKGVRDVGDAGQQDPAYLQEAINAVFVDPVNGGGVTCRLGFGKMTGATGLGTFVGCLHSIITSDGTAYLFAVVDAKVYRYSTGTTWTDVTPVGPTIATDSGNPVHAVSFGDSIIFCDNEARPWRATDLGATPIIGTNIQINTAADAWIARGRPTIYGGKVFFVVTSITTTEYSSRIVWSEELDATTGYLQDTFTNSWDIVQSNDEQINGLLGTNAALYYFRTHSIGAITGVVNSTFATTATHDAVSQEVGAGRPGLNGVMGTAPIVARGYVWFMDQEGRPNRFRVGSTDIEPLWMQLRHRIRWARLNRAGVSISAYRHQVSYVPEHDKVAVRFIDDRTPAGVVQHSRSLDIFDAVTGNYEGQWIIGLSSQTNKDSQATGVQITTFSPEHSDVLVSSGYARFVVAGNLPGTAASPGANDTGHVYRMDQPMSIFQGDPTSAMHFSITTMLTPDEQNVELRVDEIALETVPDTTAVSLDYYAPRGSSTGLTMAGTASADSIQSSYDHGIQRAALGAAAFGRWFRAVFHINVPVSSSIGVPVFERASLKIRAFPAGPLSP